MAESGLLDVDVDASDGDGSDAPLLWDLDDVPGVVSGRKCKLRVDLIPLLRILRPRLLSSTLMQIPSILAAIPKHSQARETQETPPDYSNLESWSAHPQRQPGRAVEDVNHLKLPDETIVPPKLRPCDCFFVHDSTLIPAISSPCARISPPRWNAPLREPAELVSRINEQTDLRVAAGAAPFNRLCRIYAPRYRQVNVMCIALMMPPSPFARWKQLEQALEVAYQDVRRAFVRFIEETRGRPFFIAGHSQGTMHLTRLLQEEIDPFPSRARRFLHGYLAGQTVPLSIFQPMKHLRPSRCATDLCSISSWRTAPPGVLVVVICGLIFHAGRGWKKLRREILATNPISWRSGVSPSSKASEYRGAAFPLPRNMPSVWEAWPVSGVALRFGNRLRESVAPLGCRVTDLSHIDCGKVSAEVDHTGATRVPQFPKDCWFTLAEDDFLRYHDLDIALFFGNLRANCEERYRAFLPRGRL